MNLIGSLGVVALAGIAVGVGAGVSLSESSGLNQRADDTYRKARQNQAREEQFDQFLKKALEKIAAGDSTIVEAFDDGSLDQITQEARKRGSQVPGWQEKAAVSYLLALPTSEARKNFAKQTPTLIARTDFGHESTTVDGISSIEYGLTLPDGSALPITVRAQSADPRAELRIYSAELLTQTMPRLAAVPANNHRAQALTATPLSAPHNTFIAPPRR